MGKLEKLVLRELDIFRRKFYESSFSHLPILKVDVLVAHLCLTLCNSMDYSLPGSSVHGVLQARITGVGCHSLLQGIFPTQELTPGLLHCGGMLYHLSHQGSPATLRKALTPLTKMSVPHKQ